MFSTSNFLTKDDSLVRKTILKSGRLSAAEQHVFAIWARFFCYTILENGQFLKFYLRSRSQLVGIVLPGTENVSGRWVKRKLLKCIEFQLFIRQVRSWKTFLSVQMGISCLPPSVRTTATELKSTTLMSCISRKLPQGWCAFYKWVSAQAVCPTYYIFQQP